MYTNVKACTNVIFTNVQVCCGAQMSSAYRHRLWGTRRLSAESARAWDRAGRVDDQCETADLKAVETRLVASRLFSECKLDAIRRLSKRDRYFDGSYCVRANKATARLRLGFNDHKYKNV